MFNFCFCHLHIENEHLQAKQLLNNSMINYCLRCMTNCLKYRIVKGLCFNYIDFTLSPPVSQLLKALVTGAKDCHIKSVKTRVLWQQIMMTKFC